MLRRRIFSLVLCLGLMTGLLSVSASAAEVKSGVYTASMVTTYYNPDTGNVDDGGTANAALGEGMCRSATDETCLVEVDGDDIWITVRLLLQSNCSSYTTYHSSVEIAMVKRRFAGKVEVADDSSSQCGQRCCCDQDFLFHLHSSSCCSSHLHVKLRFWGLRDLFQIHGVYDYL